MKMSIAYLMLILISTSCKSQHNTNTFINKQKQMNVIIKNNSEKLDTSLLFSKGIATPLDSSGKNFNYYYKYEKDRTVVIIEGNKTSGFIYNEFSHDSYFFISKTYYPNANIKSKGLAFNALSAFKKGTWYFFNESGDIIDSQDYDRPFKFTFQNVLILCSKERIEVKPGYLPPNRGFYTRINRSIHSKYSCQWSIRWLKKHDVIEEIIIDGNSGKILSRKETPFINS